MATIDFRYKIKVRPEDFNVRCPQCGANTPMHHKSVYLEETEKGRWQLLDSAKSSTATLTGKLSCKECGYSKNTSISWPDDAFYQFEIKGKHVWAWNKDTLLLLRDWVASNQRVADDFIKPYQLNTYVYHNFLANLPKHIVLAKNRAAILKKIDALLK